MKGHITKLLSLSCFFGGYYLASRHYKLSLQNRYLGKILSFIDIHKPQYSIVFFKVLLKLKLIQKHPKLSDYVLKDFDFTGNYLQEVRELGFKGLEIGPVSFNPSTSDQEDYSLGVKHTLSYICGFANTNTCQNFQVHLNLAPNYQVLKFAPYLLQENLNQVFRFFAEIQRLKGKKIVNGIIVDFERKIFPLQQSAETQKLKESIKSQCILLLKEVNESIKDEIKLDFQKRKYKCMSWKELLESIKENTRNI